MTIFSHAPPSNLQTLHAVLQIYADSFPLNERHSAELIRERMLQGRYRLMVGWAQEEVVFFALLWPLRGSEFILLDYMATKSGYRGQGIASEFLRSFPQMEELAGKFLVLEIENPAYGDNRQERAERIEFYRRQGVKQLQGVRYVMPGLSGGEPTEMVLMMFPQFDDGIIGAETVRKIITQIYQELYSRGAEDDLLRSLIHEVSGCIQLV